MYLSANLPEMYGVFNKIRKDNYPFNRNFEEYLETIALLGMQQGLTATQLIGFIEESLLGDERLPDIPIGETPALKQKVTFRFRIKNEKIETYYSQQRAGDLTNRMVTLLIIRMTLRLSERFGTSLQRLRLKIENIEVDNVLHKDTSVTIPMESEQRVDNYVDNRDNLIKNTDNDKPIVDNTVDNVDKSETTQPVSVLERLEKITQKGDEALGTTAKDEEKNEDEDEDVVVATNPFLEDFIGS